MNDGAVIDRLFKALADGDLAAAGDCFTPDVRVWHSFDRIAHDRASILASFAALFATFRERRFEGVQRQPTPTGFVQQHMMIVKGDDNRSLAWPVCIVVRVEDGRIARIEEYLDRAGSFTPAAERL